MHPWGLSIDLLYSPRCSSGMARKPTGGIRSGFLPRHCPWQPSDRRSFATVKNLPSLERASVRKILKSGEAFFLSFLVCAVQQLPKILSRGEQHAFEIRFFRHRKKHRTKTAVFCNHDGFSDSNSLTMLLSLA